MRWRAGQGWSHITLWGCDDGWYKEPQCACEAWLYLGGTAKVLAWLVAQ